jgi:hypothetical protein
MSDLNESVPIGYLKVLPGEKGFRVICKTCAGAHASTMTPVFRINIEPYRQDCGLCFAILVEGDKNWPILYTGV